MKNQCSWAVKKNWKNPNLPVVHTVKSPCWQWWQELSSVTLPICICVLWFKLLCLVRAITERATQQTHGAILTSLWHQNDVVTFWRHDNDVIIVSCVRWICHFDETFVIGCIGSYDLWIWQLSVRLMTKVWQQQQKKKNRPFPFRWKLWFYYYWFHCCFVIDKYYTL